MKNLNDEHLVRNHTQLASDLAETAFEFSLKKDYSSPFSKRAKEQNINYIGGKSDDITVISSQIIIKE